MKKANNNQFIIIPLITLFLIITYISNTSNSSHDKPTDNSSYSFKKITLNDNTFDVIKINPQENKLKLFWKNEEGEVIGSIKKLKEWLKIKDESLIFATNAGIFDKNFKPLGLYINEGEKVAEIDLKEGAGNFYLKPNGVFSMYDDKAKIIESNSYKDDPIIKFAIQSGPLLLLNGEIHPAFNQTSESKYIRSGVGIDEGGQIVFAISNEPVNFYNFALLFKNKLNSPNALYLDGAISEMYLPKNNRNEIDGHFSVMIGLMELR